MYASPDQDREAALSELITAPSAADVRRYLDRLELSADAKSVLRQTADVTLRIGDRIVAIGRKIIAVALSLVRISPNAVFGVVMALIVSTLVAAVPVVGGLLAALVGPLLMAFGLTMGAVIDMKTGLIATRLDEFIAVVSSAVGEA